MSLLLFSIFRFPLLTLTRSLLASGNFQPLISCLYIYISLLSSSSVSFDFTLSSSLIPSFPSSHVPAPFLFLNKPIQTLGLNPHSHLMASQTSTPALTLSLNSRAPTQHNQNQSPSLSQTHATCLRLTELPWWQPRPIVFLSPRPGCSVPHAQGITLKQALSFCLPVSALFSSPSHTQSSCPFPSQVPTPYN